MEVVWLLDVFVEFGVDFWVYGSDQFVDGGIVVYVVNLVDFVVWQCGQCYLVDDFDFG